MKKLFKYLKERRREKRRQLLLKKVNLIKAQLSMTDKEWGELSPIEMARLGAIPI